MFLVKTKVAHTVTQYSPSRARWHTVASISAKRNTDQPGQQFVQPNYMSVLCVAPRLMCIAQHTEDMRTAGHQVCGNALTILRQFYPHPMWRILDPLVTAGKNSRIVLIF
jgi:hypothetical protein